MVLAITPRHRRVSAVISSALASAISLIMFCNPLAARAEYNSKYVIKDALIGPNALIEPYIPMGCEGTDRRWLSRMGKFDSSLSDIAWDSGQVNWA